MSLYQPDAADAACGSALSVCFSSVGASPEIAAIGSALVILAARFAFGYVVDVVRRKQAEATKEKQP